jgi:hypothetical protein
MPEDPGVIDPEEVEATRAPARRGDAAWWNG